MTANLETVIRKRRDQAELLACLRRHGICVVPRYYDAGFVDAITTRCLERALVPEDTNFPDGSYRRWDTYQSTAAAANLRVYHVDCFSKEAEEFKQDPLLKAVASDYYGEPHSVHVCVYERHQHHPVPVRGFHIDTFELSTFKVMLYLTDVTPKDGPTSYVLGTHRNAELRYKKQHVWGPAVSPGDPSQRPHPTNFTNEELGDLLQHHVTVTAPRGTIVFFDTWGVHKGLSPAPEGDRHVLVNYYRKGANLPRSDFGFDAAKDYRRYALGEKV
jgi:hypothetical protein